ncbi:MAG: hypothetical protein EAZ30_12080 [Betaproteobacteria bacterium]|nr:MAG: hypothetical protein EAZ30_12080 [Betaproteobacteria bacterium]
MRLRHTLCEAIENPFVVSPSNHERETYQNPRPLLSNLALDITSQSVIPAPRRAQILFLSQQQDGALIADGDRSAFMVRQAHHERIFDASR